MTAPWRRAFSRVRSRVSAPGVSREAAISRRGGEAMISTVQQAINSLLLTYEPQFLNFAFTLFRSFPFVFFACPGLRLLFIKEPANTQDRMLALPSFLLFISLATA